MSHKFIDLRALVSYPGSGNTWLRSLIEMMTGFVTAESNLSEPGSTSTLKTLKHS